MADHKTRGHNRDGAERRKNTTQGGEGSSIIIPEARSFIKSPTAPVDVATLCIASCCPEVVLLSMLLQTGIASSDCLQFECLCL